MKKHHVESMPLFRPRAAGTDVGSRSYYLETDGQNGDLLSPYYSPQLVAG
ncbi:MAG: hypothetical protein AAGC64_05585 [Bacteroidota bacterium]